MRATQGGLRASRGTILQGQCRPGTAFTRGRAVPAYPRLLLPGVCGIAVLACVPVPTSLPSERRADAQSEYRIHGHTIMPPPGRWVAVTPPRGGYHCSDDHMVPGAVDRARAFFAGALRGLVGPASEQLQFGQVDAVRVDIGLEMPDFDSCLVVTAFPVADPGPFSGNPALLADAVRANVRTLKGGTCVFSLWSWSGCKEMDTMARLTPIRVGERTLYEIRMVAADDSTRFLENELGKVVLELGAPTVFEFYFSNAKVGPKSPEWIVVQSLAPLR